MPKVLVPDSMSRFECNLQGCCCKGWRITFTPDDIVRLTSPFSDEERAEILTGLSVYLQEEKRVTALQLRTLPPDGTCQFLAEDKRCRLQVEHGLKVLPQLCVAYPGVAYQLPDGRVELQFDSTCPEVLRQLDESSAPMQLVELEPPADHHVALRSHLPAPAPECTIGDRDLPAEEVVHVKRVILDAINGSEDPALELLCRISHSFTRLAQGEPIEAFEVRASEPTEAFEAFFETAVGAHGGRALGGVLGHYRRFVFDLDLDYRGLMEGGLEYDPEWAAVVDPRAPELQPLLRRYLFHCFFNSHCRSRDNFELMFTWGQNTHTFATAFRYALGFVRALDRPVDRVLLRTALGASEFFYRYVRIPPRVMPWFGLKVADSDDAG